MAIDIHENDKNFIYCANSGNMSDLNYSNSGAKVSMQYKRFMCLLCGFIYDEELGWPDDGIEPGTRWEDVPLTWQCPECGATKDDFEMVQI